MTYIFDPDRWYGIERSIIDNHYKNGDMDDGEYGKTIKDLERRYHEMLQRLDGTFQLPE